MMRWVIYQSMDGVTEAVWDRDVANVLDGWDNAVPIAVVEDNSAMMIRCAENPDVHELHLATRGWSAREILWERPYHVKVTRLVADDAG